MSHIVPRDISFADQHRAGHYRPASRGVAYSTAPKGRAKTDIPDIHVRPTLEHIKIRHSRAVRSLRPESAFCKLHMLRYE
jgi:hypothetical protein